MPRKIDPRTYDECLSPQWLESEVDPGSWRRGLKYFREGRASLVEAIVVEEGYLGILGRCQGSRVDAYEQEISLIPERQGMLLMGYCDCPVGFDCKHVVAVMLEWQRQMSGSGIEKADPVDAWLEGLATWAEGAGRAGEEALLYLLSPAQRNPQILVPEFAVARPRADGWTPGRRTVPVTLNNPRQRPGYLSGADEEILALIRACLPVHSIGPGFQLTGASGYLALERMVQTGRCFLDSDRDQPLRWGSARELEVSWNRDDGAFRVDLALAEGGQMLDLDPPAYLDVGRHLVGRLDGSPGLDRTRIRALMTAPPIPVDRAAGVARAMALSLPDLPTPVAMERQEIREPPQPVLRVDFDPRVPQMADARLHFLYGGRHVEPGARRC